jgi:PemK-like, MazF-like toxin of type II toxin-antitoxin system
MPPKPPKNKTVGTLKHDEARRKNISTAEHQSVMAEEEKNPIQVAYERRNRDLDPQLVWRGKDEQDWSDLVVSASPLYTRKRCIRKCWWMICCAAVRSAQRRFKTCSLTCLPILMSIQRGQIYFVNLNPVQGREQVGQRPVLVLSINEINALPSDSNDDRLLLKHQHLLHCQGKGRQAAGENGDAF